MKSIFTAFGLTSILLSLAFSCCISTMSLQAQKIWLGNTSDWHTDSNWDPVGVPTLTDVVLIQTSISNPEISSITSVNKVTIFEGAELTIQSTGNLQISNSSQDGLHVLGELINEGNINITNCAFRGIFNSPSGEISNRGEILITGITSNNGFGIVNTGIFLNESGNIIIDDSNGGGIRNWQGSQFTNNASLIIGSNEGISTHGIRNQESIFLNESGTITIKNANVGIINEFESSFTNEAMINIDHIVNSGIANAQNSIFTNGGHITIGNNLDNINTGILNSGAMFANELGYIKIYNTETSMIQNTSSGTFFNNAIIIGESLQGNSIFNFHTSTSFNNTACAEIRVDLPLVNSGPFYNDGHLYINTPEVHTTGNFFTNNGLITDIQGTLLQNNTLINNEIIIDPDTGSCSDFTPAFNLANSIDFAIYGVYTDMNLTSSAGTYDQGTNTFTCNLSPGMHTLFVDVEDTESGCSYIAEWNVTIESSLPPAGKPPPMVSVVPTATKPALTTALKPSSLPAKAATIPITTAIPIPMDLFPLSCVATARSSPRSYL